MADHDREGRIRQKAYKLWEDEGRPEGRHEDHWHQASRLSEDDELNAEQMEALDRGAGGLDGGVLQTGGLVAAGGPSGAGLGGLGMTDVATAGPEGFDSGATAAAQIAPKPKRAPRKKATPTT